MNYKRKFKKELNKIPHPSIQNILKNIPDTYQITSKQNSSSMRIAFIPLVAIILCSVILASTVFAIPMIINHRNAKLLSNNNVQLDTVPDGYIGIYTVEDLNNIRNDLNSNYILMSDICFSDEDYNEGSICQDGWIPIGSENDDPQCIFNGIFNGNGYIIKNLRLNQTNAVKKPYWGLFGDTNGNFINLGIEEYILELSLENHDTFVSNYVCVGAIAARASFVGGCYVNCSEINISLENCRLDPSILYGTQNEKNTLCVGGICGIADYIDSCMVYTDISIFCDNSFAIYAGLCSGQSLSCMTSYTVGNIHIDEKNRPSAHIDGISTIATDATMPIFLDDNSMNKIINRLETLYGENSFAVNKFKRFYIRIEPSNDSDNFQNYKKLLDVNAQFGYVYLDDTGENTDSIYIFDRASRPDEVREANKILSETFDSSENFTEFCFENNIKCGMICCYSFNNDSEINMDTLTGFDFDNIWIERDEKIILRIFDN